MFFQNLLIQFIRLSKFRILTIFVAKSGFLKNKIVITDQDFDQESLDQMANMLNERFKNKTLGKIRNELAELLEEDKKKYNLLLESAVRIGEIALSNDESKNSLYIIITV